MASNWQVEARGIIYWEESSRRINFDGNTYNPTFIELNPERYEKDLIKEVDDQTIKLTVQDPNGLV
jgi:hypothetical protein